MKLSSLLREEPLGRFLNLRSVSSSGRSRATEMATSETATATTTNTHTKSIRRLLFLPLLCA